MAPATAGGALHEILGGGHSGSAQPLGVGRSDSDDLGDFHGSLLLVPVGTTGAAPGQEPLTTSA